MNSTLGQDMAANHTLIDNTNNTSRQPGEIHKLWVDLTINIFICLFTITGNGLLLWTVYKVESLQTVTNMFIVNLSGVDLFTGVIVLPMAMATNYVIPLITGNYIQNKFVCLLKTFLLLSCNGLSVLGLIGIAIERYIAILYPLRYINLMTVNKAKIFIVSLWVYILSITLIMFIDGLNVYQHGQQCTTNNTLEPSYFMLLKMNIFLPVLVTIIVYSKIAWVAYKHRVKIHSELASIDNARAVAYKNEHSFMRTSTIVNVVFIIMYGQFMIISSIKLSPEPEWYRTLWNVSSAILWLNSGVNPWIYAMRHKKFKKAMLFALKIKPNEDDIA
ncbi:unnamed protein product [Owenia fusiformis]|uniref:G-protein coupled receptors family 1 profile domain-containing protein n=1 Tax=Owenia fusiformis TaxID=6347 RepID=A0A8S4PP36_OWEFU|nr:unnamed protein product [Owenia fusiformis]